MFWSLFVVGFMCDFCFDTTFWFVQCCSFSLCGGAVEPPTAFPAGHLVHRRCWPGPMSRVTWWQSTSFCVLARAVPWCGRVVVATCSYCDVMWRLVITCLGSRHSKPAKYWACPLFVYRSPCCWYLHGLRNECEPTRTSTSDDILFLRTDPGVNSQVSDLLLPINIFVVQTRKVSSHLLRGSPPASCARYTAMLGMLVFPFSFIVSCRISFGVCLLPMFCIAVFYVHGHGIATPIQRRAPLEKSGSTHQQWMLFWKISRTYTKFIRKCLYTCPPTCAYPSSKCMSYRLRSVLYSDRWSLQFLFPTFSNMTLVNR